MTIWQNPNVYEILRKAVMPVVIVILPWVLRYGNDLLEENHTGN